VSSFTYLGGTVGEDGGADEDVRSRIRETKGAFIQSFLYGEIETSPKGLNSDSSIPV
jgi:hypothetical protein